MLCIYLQVCGFPGVIPDGIRLLRTGGLYVLAGMVHPNSNLDITGEQIIRKCVTIKGKYQRMLELTVRCLLVYQWPFDSLSVFLFLFIDHHQEFTTMVHNIWMKLFRFCPEHVINIHLKNSSAHLSNSQILNKPCCSPKSKCSTEFAWSPEGHSCFLSLCSLSLPQLAPVALNKDNRGSESETALYGGLGWRKLSFIKLSHITVQDITMDKISRW